MVLNGKILLFEPSLLSVGRKLDYCVIFIINIVLFGLLQKDGHIGGKN